MQLDWDKYMEIADRFQRKARYQDREDLKHDIIVRLAELASNNGDKPFTEPSMLRVGSYVVLEYWRREKRELTMLSLNDEIEDDEGTSVELYQTLADDNAIDLELWLDARRWLLGCPRRLVRIAHKKVKHQPLTSTERSHLRRSREKELAKREKAFL
jgi:DNA-directed RNA polymerase specialized sigma24 family protein